MDSSSSILMTTIERIRTYLDDPTLDAKYTNDFLVRHIIEPEMVNVITAINQQRDEPILCKFSLDSLEDTNTSIELPPNVGIVHRITKLNDDGTVLDDIAKRDETDPRGPGWHLDGRDLHIRPDWTPDTAGYEVWYTPSGDFIPHYSADGGTLISGALTFTLDAAPDVGDYDRRESAYIGGVLRVWNAANTIIQEQVISGYDVSTRTVTVRTAFGTTDIPVADTLRYEIVPEYMGQIWQTIAIASAMNLGVARNITEKQMAYLKEQFALSLQTSMVLTASKVQNKAVSPEDSVLHTMLQRIRWGLPEQVEKKMSDDYIMRSAIVPKLAEVISSINSRNDSQIVNRHSFTFVNQQEYYALPPCIGKVLRLAKISATGVISDEIRQRDDNDPQGNGWAVEGNRISIRPNPATGDLSSYQLWYLPSGNFLPHYAKDGILDSAGKILTLSSGGLFSRLLGTIDKRDNSYVGATLRVFESNGSISERTIASHGAATPGVSVTEAFQTIGGSTTVAYEIVAPWQDTVMSAVVAKAILELMALKGGVQEADLAILAESAKSALSSSMVSIRNKRALDIVPNPNSHLHMVLEKTKTIIRDIAKELDYSDDFIFRHGIVPEYSRVMSRVQNTSSDYIINKYNLITVANQQYYDLPASIGEIIRIVILEADGRISKEIMPRNQFSTRGPNWSLEGNSLSIRPYPQTAQTYEIWYISTNDVKPHYAEDGSLAADGLSLDLTNNAWSSNALGDLDRRRDIYVGSTIRIINSIGIIEEKIINGYTETSRRVNFRSVCVNSAGFGSTSVVYEVVPAHFGAVVEAVSQGAAMNLLVGARRVTKAQHAMLMINFKSAMKTAMDYFTFMQNRVPKSYEKDTVDNRNRYGGLYGIR